MPELKKAYKLPCEAGPANVIDLTQAYLDQNSNISCRCCFDSLDTDKQCAQGPMQIADAIIVELGFREVL